jgi:hypothetical protein
LKSCNVWFCAASGKILYVDAIEIATSLAGFVELSRETTPRTTLIFQGQNRNIAGAASVGALRSDSAAGLFGTTLLRTRMPADVSVTFNFNPPLRLIESRGVNAGNSPVNADLSANFFYREKLT